jgi:phospholipase C
MASDGRDEPDVERTLSRRGVLQAGVGLAAAGAGAGVLGGVPGAQAAVDPNVTTALPRDPSRSGIDHIVVVMMENRSFDHYFGWVPGADGRQAGLSFADKQGVRHRTYHLHDYQGCSYNDPDHSYEGGYSEFNGGACDGWLRTSTNDLFCIGYYTAPDLAFYRHAATQWTIFDRYFSATMAETYPNRFYQHAAQTDRVHNQGTGSALPQTSTLPTIWDRLAAAGISGRYYATDVPFTALWGTKYLPITGTFQEFLASAGAGTLPAVSYVDPKFLDEGSGGSADDHPHADIRAGQAFLNSVYDAVTTSPNWPRTALLINYDEWGGFYDHVPPTRAPDQSRPIDVPGKDMSLRGFRTPCTLISPRARRGYVAHNVYDHTSVLKMIEWRFGLKPLTKRDAAARNIAEVLDFAHPPNLTAPRYPVPSFVGAPCGAGSTADYEEWRKLSLLAARSGFTIGA